MQADHVGLVVSEPVETAHEFLAELVDREGSTLENQHLFVLKLSCGMGRDLAYMIKHSCVPLEDSRASWEDYQNYHGFQGGSIRSTSENSIFPARWAAF